MLDNMATLDNMAYSQARLGTARQAVRHGKARHGKLMGIPSGDARLFLRT